MRTPRVGPVTFFRLLNRFGSATAALDALPSLGSKDLGQHIPRREEIEREWEETHRFGATFLFAHQLTFPVLLKQNDPPPPVLTVCGRTQVFEKRCVAIVGARQASAVGRKIAREMAADLSKQGYAIASGLARGVDGEAHAASLEGGTIAVLGGGIDHIYPPQHKRLYEAIRESGVLVSESPLFYRATAKDFPRRNRIITGLSEGVVIIEAAERSGSLISARTALEQNRDVMSVPASPLEPRAAGSNRLLKEGAILVRHADDVIEALDRPISPRMSAPDPPNYEAETDRDDEFPRSQIEAVKEVLSLTPATIDEIARAANIGPARCASVLVELELLGIARTYAGGLASLAV